MSLTSLRRYLDHHAEPIVGLFEAQICRTLGRTYESVVVVPIYDEPLDFLDRVISQVDNTLVILVVNAPEEDGDRTPLHRTQTLLAQLGAGAAPLTIVPYRTDTDLLVVDCCTEGRRLPRGQGVGLARKIGADLAVASIANQVVTTSWIHCTDADVMLPLEYFDATDLGNDVAVAIYPFSHQPVHENILFYEIWLRYYVTQLAAMGSPYAFHTIGSLLKINVQHYVAVRGFPKRQAAEDFYVLNKLAKTGQVIRLKTPQILLSSRISHRVPFGTGAAMGRLSKNQEFVLYHPQVFRHLKIWLGLVEELWRDRTNITQIGVANWWQQTVDKDNILLLKTLQHLGLDKMLGQAYRQCRDECHFKFFVWVWFDGFRTLKFVHYLRDHYFASLPLTDALRLLAGEVNAWGNLASELNLMTLQRINERLISIEQQLPAEVGPTMCLEPLRSHR
ncbi:MAG: hypothetical protein F6K19_10195 [Cyanothece sp. SIO1E1]|nr:hypothetical protein [Cyanothece sp. SIO1E1]